MRLEGRTVVVGVTGGIACYKACELVRQLVAAGMQVRVVMTANAQQFVTPLTLQTLSGHPVATETFSLTQESEIGHIRLADSADVVVIAPATANALAKIATGIADDLLTHRPPRHPRAARARARDERAHVGAPRGAGEPGAPDRARRARRRARRAALLACGYEGAGRLADPAEIVEAVAAALAPQDLAGEHVLVIGRADARSPSTPCATSPTARAARWDTRWHASRVAGARR